MAKRSSRILYPVFIISILTYGMTVIFKGINSAYQEMDVQLGTSGNIFKDSLSNVWNLMFNLNGLLFKGNWIIFTLFHIYFIVVVFKLMRGSFLGPLDFLEILFWPAKPIINLILKIKSFLYDFSIIEKYTYKVSDEDMRIMVIRESLIMKRYYVESYYPLYFNSKKIEFKKYYSGPDKQKAEASFLINKI